MERDGPWQQHNWIEHTQLMLDSFRRWVGRDLIPRTGSFVEEAAALFHAPFVVVSHGTQDDPVLNYGNQAALDLWEMDVETLQADCWICSNDRQHEPVGNHPVTVIPK